MIIFIPASFARLSTLVSQSNLICQKRFHIQIKHVGEVIIKKIKESRDFVQRGERGQSPKPNFLVSILVNEIILQEQVLSD